jgi:hypothetical protein
MLRDISAEAEDCRLVMCGLLLLPPPPPPPPPPPLLLLLTTTTTVVGGCRRGTSLAAGNSIGKKFTEIHR